MFLAAAPALQTAIEIASIAFAPNFDLLSVYNTFDRNESRRLDFTNNSSALNGSWSRTYRFCGGRNQIKKNGAQPKFRLAPLGGNKNEEKNR